MERVKEKFGTYFGETRMDGDPERATHMLYPIETQEGIEAPMIDIIHQDIENWVVDNTPGDREIASWMLVPSQHTASGALGRDPRTGQPNNIPYGVVVFDEDGVAHTLNAQYLLDRSQQGLNHWRNEAVSQWQERTQRQIEERQAAQAPLEAVEDATQQAYDRVIREGGGEEEAQAAARQAQIDEAITQRQATPDPQDPARGLRGSDKLLSETGRRKIPPDTGGLRWRVRERNREANERDSEKIDLLLFNAEQLVKKYKGDERYQQLHDHVKNALDNNRLNFREAEVMFNTLRERIEND
jgi:hypothetical protein